jgi:hypothetical protein
VRGVSGAELPPLRGATPPSRTDAEPDGLLARIAASCIRWSERWIPDAFVFALIATVIAAAGALSTGVGRSPSRRSGATASGSF